RRPLFVERHRVEAELHVRRKLEMVSDVELREDEAEVRHAERGDDIPQAQEPDLRILLDDGAVLLDAVRCDLVGEIEREGRAATEADDVDGPVAGIPGGAELLVRAVDAIEPADAEGSADDLADLAESCADARDVEIGDPLALRLRVVVLVEAPDVGRLSVR